MVWSIYKEITWHGFIQSISMDVRLPLSMTIYIPSSSHPHTSIHNFVTTTAAAARGTGSETDDQSKAEQSKVQQSSNNTSSSRKPSRKQSQSQSYRDSLVVNVLSIRCVEVTARHNGLPVKFKFICSSSRCQGQRRSESHTQVSCQMSVGVHC